MTNEITISKAEYDSKTRKATFLNLLCEQLAREWIDGEQRGYGGISDNVKQILMSLDPDRASIAEKKAEAKNAERFNRAIERLKKEEPHVYPYLAPDCHGVPLREIIIGDDPGSDPQITCEEE